MSDMKTWLDEVRRRYEAATEGPCHVLRENMESGAIRYEMWIGDPRPRSDDLTPPVLISSADDCPATVKHDMELFRHARTDVPDMERVLRAVVEECERLGDSSRGSMGNNGYAANAILAAMERARGGGDHE